MVFIRSKNAFWLEYKKRIQIVATFTWGEQIYCKAVDKMNELVVFDKVLDLKNKNGADDSNSVKHLANVIVREHRSEFGLYDVPNCDNWIDFILNGDYLENNELDWFLTTVVQFFD